MFIKISFLILAVSSITAAELCENGKDDHCMALDSPQSSFNQDTDWEKAESIYQFHAKDINEIDVSLDKFRGHVMIVVNVASECGLTQRNYEQLVQLHEKYGDSKGLKILAFPSNQFNNQEPGSNKDILKFAKDHNVKFDMFAKIDVNGDNAHPLWKWLKTQKGGFLTDSIKWNFSKFLVNKDGKVVDRYAPTKDPLSIEEDLKKYF